MASIEANNKINRIRLNHVPMPKAFGYADDLAIIVPDVTSIAETLSQYRVFSLVSGLYLNVEKTEIIE